MDTIFIDLEDKMVATIAEKYRKKIKYTCSSCKPEKDNTPCVESCKQNAIKCIWNQKKS
jgi:Fe-S-cluster-containing hydrogenase component 2